MLNLVIAFFATWQVRVLLGLILLDIALGIAAAFRTNTFDFVALAEFYRKMILPYVIGYGALFVAIKLIIPPDFGMLSETLITVAWGALVASLLRSIQTNLKEIYTKEFEF